MGLASGMLKMPKDVQGLKSNTAGGERICWNFSPAKGCKLAKPGEACKRGVHVCMTCEPPHPYEHSRKE